MTRETADLTLDQFVRRSLPPPTPKVKPLDVHVARAAANNLIINVVNLNYEIREIVVAQGIQFQNSDIRNKAAEVAPQEDPDEFSIPKGLKDDFPDLVLRGDTRAVFISDVQHVEFRIRLVNTKTAFKEALETPGIHVIYAGHSRFGRGPCFGPELGNPPNLVGDNWEQGETGKTNDFGIFRMGLPFVGAPFKELDEHQYHMRPVPTTVRVNPADIDPLTTPGSLRPVILRGSRFETLILDPVVDSYWGCKTPDGDGVLLFADFASTKSAPFDLGATDLKCRCFTVLGCDTFKHFREVVRIRKRFTRTKTEGFAYFTVNPVPIAPATKFWIGSLFEYPERNDFEPWFDSLEFAVKRTNEKAASDSTFKYHFV